MKVKDLIDILDKNTSTLFYITYVSKTLNFKSRYFCGYLTQLNNNKYLHEYEVDKVFIGQYIDIRCK